jgi:hypothetical protein
MTLSQRLRAQLAEITPRIPEHNRVEIQDIAAGVAELDQDFMDVMHDVLRPIDEEDGS